MPPDYGPPNMPRYACHKVVEALRIAQVTADADGVTIDPADDGVPSFRLSRGWFNRFNPEPGGYFVRYADGYTSYSPAKAFEGGYTLI